MLIRCNVCYKEFERKNGEVKRAKKRGWKIFCSKDCYNLVCGRHLKDYLGIGNKANLVADNRRDELSPFRYFSKKSKSRNAKRGIDIKLTEVYLKALWEDQNGICPLTGWNLYLPTTTVGWGCGVKVTPHQASLDRIDSNKPYQEGIVRFVAFIANMCKNQFTDQDVFRFCSAVRSNTQG